MMAMEKIQAAEPSEFLEAMQQAADIMLGKCEAARVWCSPASVPNDAST